MTAPDLRVTGRVTGTPTPSAERPAPPGGGPSAVPAFAGQGSWALSALPGCFVERTRISGAFAAVRSHVPPAAERVVAGTVIRRADCTLEVRAHDVWIARGADRLRVPPEAALYRRGDRLTLVHVERGRAEIRVY